MVTCSGGTEGWRQKVLDAVAGVVQCAGSWVAGARPRPAPRRLLVSSPLEGSLIRLAEPVEPKASSGYGYYGGQWRNNALGPEFAGDAERPQPGEERWRGFCACCKRPLTLALTDAQPRQRKRLRSGDGGGGDAKYAYVVAIWGSNMEYVLGALVLGHSIRSTGSKHDLVAMHTDDVPAGAVELLRRGGWIPRLIEYVDAAPTLYQDHCLASRFAKVFTKLQVFGLVEYAKVVMLDADMLVRQNIDDLFELEAPAAMTRGPWSGYRHGDAVDGRSFFGGLQPGIWSWGQGTGINAGVMLLEPSEATRRNCLAEVGDACHPEHAKGNGPEQDYLSRYFASTWNHVDVSYNFQLHQMYYALSPTVGGSDRQNFFEPEGVERIKVFHYSSEPKPWGRQLDDELAQLSDEEWMTAFKRNFTGYKVWVLEEPTWLEREVDRSGKVALGPDGALHRIAWEDTSFGWAEDGGNKAPDDDFADPWAHSRPAAASADSASAAAAAGGGELRSADGQLLGEALHADPANVAAAEAITALALREWDEAYLGLAAALGERDLAAALRAAAGKPPVAAAADGPAAPAVAEKETWAAENGWWVERPLRRRATASCGLVPSPHLALTLDAGVLHSAEAFGLHAAALSEAHEACCAPLVLRHGAEGNGSSPAEAAEAWAAALPDGATVLLAVLLAPGAEAAAALPPLLAALDAGGLGCELGAAPEGCRSLAAVGRKGRGRWTQTHAGVEAAIATSYLRP